jgi:ribonuclease R
MHDQILAVLARRNYIPLKPKALARRLGVTDATYADFRKALKQLAKDGRVEFGRNHTVRAVGGLGTVTGIYRRTSSGFGFVRVHPVDGKAGPEIAIPADAALDASTGDEVLVRLTRKPSRPEARGPAGEILRVLERATRRFVGGYFERGGEGLVRVDGSVFAHSVSVGDPGAKGAKPGDVVVFEMLRFPSPDDRGEGVITEVLGERGQPGVDTLTTIHAYGLPHEFPEDALEEARAAADAFDERDLDGRKDFTGDLVITIDPKDARDFDDAVSVRRDAATGRWTLDVHIADVGHFAAPGGPLDREARKRGTSVYLPGRVVPMFPEIISNGLASLQEGRLRYVKSARMEFDADGQTGAVRFFEGAIRNRRRFTYEEVSAILAAPDAEHTNLAADVRAMLLDMRELAMLLRERRRQRGALELVMPAAELEYDEHGRVSGAHFAVNDVSHQIIEEFMLAANEAVAGHLAAEGVPILRRVHPAPDPGKLVQFAEFADTLGYTIRKPQDRFSLQRVLESSADKPEAPAVHYALLRSLKHAAYSPEPDEHYALASTHYCHFTSPIRRYPDLTVHRTLGRWLRTGKGGGDYAELVALGEHCSKTERRAESAERELVKVKLLAYLSDRLGTELDAVITGVADYGFFAQAKRFPAEGLVHVSTLTDDFYHFDEPSQTLTGRRTRRRYRLGDTVRVEVVRVDLPRRQLDFRVVVRKS